MERKHTRRGAKFSHSFFTSAYMAMEDALNKTGRPFVYACGWPLFQLGLELQVNEILILFEILLSRSESSLKEGVLLRTPPFQIDFETVAATCNTFRNFYDIVDDFESIQKTLNFYTRNQDDFTPHQKPGAFFDPDMVRHRFSIFP